MAPSHRKITFCFLPLLFTFLFISPLLFDNAECLAIRTSSAKRNPPKSTSVNNSKNPSKGEITKVDTLTATTISPAIIPNEIVYKFVEEAPKNKKRKSLAAQPEREPEERELGYYGIYDHIGAPLTVKGGGYGRRISNKNGYNKAKVLLLNHQTPEELGLNLISQSPLQQVITYDVALNNEISKCECVNE